MAESAAGCSAPLEATFSWTKDTVSDVSVNAFVCLTLKTITEGPRQAQRLSKVANDGKCWLVMGTREILA